MYKKLKKEKYKNWDMRFDAKFENILEIIGIIKNIIDKKEIKFDEILKDTDRSFVGVVKVKDKNIIFKQPKEKNRRKWIRFLTLFRKGEALKNFYIMNKAEKIGIKSNKPYLSVEKKEYGMVVDSWVIYEYIDGRECANREEYEKLFKILDDIHNKGYLHGDSQVQNFVFSGDEVYTIDCGLKKNIYGKFGKMYEYIYLRESRREIEKYYKFDIQNFYYKAAEFYKKWLYFLGRNRKKVKKLIQGVHNGKD
ncbi:lipopolysaccharide biosynthesis protein [Haliovirga abyssi]|uniref:LPS biosynthesis protein n=1 Tax=Haliovirga abyssi TaxID=2996794 RepID=A0AAU9D133_9FUSO|nr:lipopolysaccharide biosynthesis protein [Haliovirga abyssi]BDU49676.1 LPS biosynthesis protein [Haliovirga abyssi]